MIRALDGRDRRRMAARVVHRVMPVPLPQAGPERQKRRDRFAPEPFGFADGMSQPIIAAPGAGCASRDAIHTVEPGEFLLGYPDSRGFFPPSPTVPADGRPSEHAAARRSACIRTRSCQPDFRRAAPMPSATSAATAPSSSSASSSRMSGPSTPFSTERPPRVMPGTRRCRKDLDARTGWRNGSAPRWSGAGATAPRWCATRTGPGELRTASAAGSARTMNSCIGAEDPLGERCPLGAHIRRSNPRESFEAGSKEELVDRQPSSHPARRARLRRGWQRRSRGDEPRTAVHVPECGYRAAVRVHPADLGHGAGSSTGWRTRSTRSWAEARPWGDLPCPHPAVRCI